MIAFSSARVLRATRKNLNKNNTTSELSGDCRSLLLRLHCTLVKDMGTHVVKGLLDATNSVNFSLQSATRRSDICQINIDYKQLSNLVR